jgi:hypothetical protein
MSLTQKLAVLPEEKNIAASSFSKVKGRGEEIYGLIAALTVFDNI